MTSSVTEHKWGVHKFWDSESKKNINNKENRCQKVNIPIDDGLEAETVKINGNVYTLMLLDERGQ